MALLSKKPLADNGLKHNVFKPYRHPCFSTFQCVIVGVIVAIIIGSVVAVLDHLWPQPPKFEITSLSISPFDILEFRLTADWNISFHIENTNKRSLRYKDVKVSVYYQNELLSSANQNSFHQPKKSLAEYAVHASASSVLIQDNVASGFVGDWRNGIVAFRFKFHGIAKLIYSHALLVSLSHRFTVNCNNVQIARIPSNSFNVIVGGSKRCKVDL